MAKKKIMTAAELAKLTHEIVHHHDGSRISEELTVLNFGAGQDSTTLLIMFVTDRAFRAKHAPGRLLVHMSDTGNEHPATYRHAAKAARYAKANGVDFRIMTSSVARTAAAMGVTETEATDLGVVAGFHTAAWSDLLGHWRRIRSCGSVAFGKSCTSNLKILVLYRHLEAYIGQAFGLKSATKGATGRWGSKIALKKLAGRSGKIRILIGISKGEETRCKLAPEKRELWMNRDVAKVYPLIELGMDRQACQNYIAAREDETGIPVPPPSNCMACPYLSLHELLWLKRRQPVTFAEWAEVERVKLEKDAPAQAAKGQPNHGVFSDHKDLHAAIAAAEAKHGHMTDAELDDYKMSHGHCVKSSY